MGASTDLFREELERGRATLKERGLLASPVVPELMPGDISLGVQLGREKRHGEHLEQAVYAAEIAARAQSRLREVFGGVDTFQFAVKEVHLSNLPKELDVRAQVRHVTGADNVNNRSNLALAHTLGYALGEIPGDPPAERVLFVMERMDTDLATVMGLLLGRESEQLRLHLAAARELGIGDLEERVLAYDGRIGDVIREAIYPLVLGLAQYHEDMNVHRDIKPANIGVRIRSGRFASVKLFDYDLAKNDADSNLTTHRTADRFRGTPLYLPSFETRDERVRDTYATGLIIGELLGIEQREVSLIVTRQDNIEAWMRGDRPEAAANEYGLPGLERIVVRALKGGYETAELMRDHLKLVMEGRGSELCKDADMKLYWDNRGQEALPFGEQMRVRKALHRSKVIGKWLAISTFIGTLGTALVAGALDYRSLWQYRNLAETYPAGVSREALRDGNLSASDIERIGASMAGRFVEDDERFYTPQRKKNSQDSVPAGDWNQGSAAGPTFVSSSDSDAIGWLNYTLSLYSITKDDRILEAITDYLGRMRIEGGDGSDWIRSPAGRCEPVLAYRPLLREAVPALEKPEAARIECGIAVAERLALISGHQLIIDRDNRFPLNVRRISRLGPAAVALGLNPELFSLGAADVAMGKTTERLPSAVEIHHRMEEERGERIAPLTYGALVGSVFGMATHACNVLVSESGDVYGRASIAGGGLRRDIHTHATEQDVVVSVADAAGLRLYLAHVHKLYDALQREPLRSMLESDLGSGAIPALALQMEGEKGIRACSAAIDSAMSRYTGNFSRLPPEFSPLNADFTVPVLSKDTAPAGMYFLALAVEGSAAADEAAKLILSKAAMREPTLESTHYPLAMWERLLGPIPSPYAHSILDFPDSSWLYPGQHGPNVQTTGAIVRGLEKRRKTP